jgi:hypothetical protein
MGGSRQPHCRHEALIELRVELPGMARAEQMLGVGIECDGLPERAVLRRGLADQPAVSRICMARAVQPGNVLFTGSQWRARPQNTTLQCYVTG